MNTIDVSAFSGQLTENCELGNAEVLALDKVNCTALHRRGEPHVDVLAVFAHLFLCIRKRMEGACHLAWAPPRKAGHQPAAAYRGFPPTAAKLLEGVEVGPRPIEFLC